MTKLTYEITGRDNITRKADSYAEVMKLKESYGGLVKRVLTAIAEEHKGGYHPRRVQL